MKHKLGISSIILVLVIIAGCSQNTSTKAPVGGKIPFLTSDWSSSNYAATFQIYKTVIITMDSLEAVQEEAEAYLFDTAVSTPVSGGTVTVAGTVMPALDESAFHGGTYYQLNSTVPMAFDGSTAKFTVSGGTSFPALTDSTTFPNREIDMTAPVLGTSLSMSSGFTVNWSYNSGSSNWIVLQVQGDSTGYYEVVLNDNGSYFVPSSALSSFTAGEKVNILLTRICYKDAQDSYGRRYVMAAYSRRVIEHLLTS